MNLPKNITPFLLIAPAFIVVFSLAVYSLVWLSAISLHDFTFGEKIEKAVFIGLENYQWLFFNENSTFYRSLFLTAIYIGGTLVPELIFGLTIALLLHKSKMGESFFSACLIIPIILMPSMVGMIARLYFSYDGLINYFIELIFNVKLNWYGKDLALFAVILVDIWEWTPFFIIIFHAGLKTLPLAPYEAAKVEGASNFQSFIYITLPLLGPLILTAFILRFMDILRIFDVIFSMFAGGPGTATTTLPIYIYRTTLVSENVGRGSAVSIIVIVIIISLTYMMVRSRNKILFEM